MKQQPLSVYVTGVVVALVIANGIAWFAGGNEKLRSMGIFSAGFLMGMLAMYIAVHLYRWR